MQRANKTVDALKGENARLRVALESSQDLLVAMLHETRPDSELQAQIVANRNAMSTHTAVKRG